MSKYFVSLINEKGEALDGQVEYYAGGAPVGAAGIHKGGTALFFSDIPEGTTKFRFESPGYAWFSTSQLYDENTITLVKEPNPVIPAVIGAGVVAGLWLLQTKFRLWK